MAVVVLASCGQSSPAGTSPAAASSVAPDVEQRLERLRTSIFGTGQQRAAGEHIAHERYQTAIRRCMSSQGWDYPALPSLDQYVGWVPETGAEGTKWLRTLTARPVTPKAQALAVVQRKFAARGQDENSYTRLSASDKAAYDAAMAGCDAPDDLFAKERYPAGQELLAVAFRAMVDEADRRVDGQADSYAACTKAERVELKTGREVVERLEELLPDPTEVPPPGQADNPSWAAMRKEEARLAALDVKCRKAIHDLGLALLEPELTAFEGQQAVAIQNVQQGWKDIEAKAATL